MASQAPSGAVRRVAHVFTPSACVQPPGQTHGDLGQIRAIWALRYIERMSRSTTPAPKPKEPPKNERAPAAKALTTKKKPGCFARLVAAFLLAVCLGVGVLALGFAWLDATLPDVFSFEAYRQIAHESSRVYAAGGEVVAQFGDEIRTVVPHQRIPQSVLYAIVCAEDSAFYSHAGLDFVGIGRAIYTDLTRGRYAQGASTITQQFAKTRFLGREKTVTRKLKELVLARKLEKRLSKDEILALYANEVYFGHGRYGVEEAARFFFDKSVSEIDVAQAAMLAGIVNSPAKFSPLRHPENALLRRRYVLEQMTKHGYINQSDFERADKEPLPTQGHDKTSNIGEYFVEDVRKFVLNKVDREALLYGGLRIEIALDVAMQQAAEEAVEKSLNKLDRQFKSVLAVKHYDDEAAVQQGLQKLAAQVTDGKLRAGRTLLGVVRGSDEKKQGWLLDLGGVTGLLPFSAVQRYQKMPDAALQNSDNLPPTPVRYVDGDLLRVSVREQNSEGVILSPEFGPQAALVAIEPSSRLVRALVGGDDFSAHPFNRATDAKRQAGSTFKTFTYGAALESAGLTPDSEMNDEERSFVVGGRKWTPRNFSGKYDGRAYSMRDALAYSINSIAVAVAAQVGPEKIAEFAHRAGVRSELKADLPLALGASSVSPLELTNAFTTIAAGGKFAEPILVTRIVGRDGKDLYLAPRGENTVVFAEPLVRALTDMLGEVTRKGSGKEAKVGRPVAGKTGTSNGGRDLWFVGFSVDLCTGVWIGYDDRKPMAKASGGALAVPLWALFMQKLWIACPHNRCRGCRMCWPDRWRICRRLR